MPITYFTSSFVLYRKWADIYLMLFQKQVGSNYSYLIWNKDLNQYSWILVFIICVSERLFFIWKQVWKCKLFKQTERVYYLKLGILCSCAGARYLQFDENRPGSFAVSEYHSTWKSADVVHLMEGEQTELGKILFQYLIIKICIKTNPHCNENSLDAGSGDEGLFFVLINLLKSFMKVINVYIHKISYLSQILNLEHLYFIVSCPGLVVMT